MPPRRSRRIYTSHKGMPSTQCSVSGQETATVFPQSPHKRQKLGSTALSDADDEGEPDQCLDDSEAEKEITPPPKKKRRLDATIGAAPKRHIKGKRGILQKMTDTPLDVLFEIFSYLEPLDLLRMSRTTKDLRALLMTKSSAFVWERARLGMKDLPPFFDDLNEPQYANLVFDSHCHKCGKHPIKNAQWEARLRLCKGCLQEGSIMTSNMADHVDLLNRFDDLITVTPKYQLTVATGREIKYFHLPTYQLLFEECVSMNDQLFQEWLSTKRVNYSVLAQTCREYRRWSSSKRYVRNIELQSLRRGRIESIIHRLQADGWAEELKDYRVMDTIRKHKLARQSKALTDRIWINIRPTLTKVVTDGRAILVAERIRTAIARRMTVLVKLCRPLLARMSEHQANPSASMIPYLEPFFGIIKNAPLELDITVANFSEALVNLPEVCTTWRERRDADLKKILLENGRSDNLLLAVNAFTCTASDCLSSPPVLHYPHFASHACFVRCVLMGEKDNTLVNVWNPSAIAPVTKDACDRFESLVRMCRLDPAVATAGDMDDIKPFFTCEDSSLESNDNSRLIMMDWRYAMGHANAHPDRLKRVEDPGQISRFKRLEAADLTKDLNSTGCDDPFICVHCGMTDLTWWRERATHLHHQHGILDDMSSGKHFKRSSKSGHTSKYLVDIQEETPLQALLRMFARKH